MVKVLLLPMLHGLYFVSTFLSKCAVASMAVFCSFITTVSVGGFFAVGNSPLSQNLIIILYSTPCLKECVHKPLLYILLL